MSENFPNHLKYTKDHEWALLEKDGTLLVGITSHAQEALGEIVFLELPQKGRKVKKGETIGVVESIKAVSDIYAPISGEIIETHEELTKNPGQINSDPYKQGWMIRVKSADAHSADDLLEPKAYEDFVSSLK